MTDTTDRPSTAPFAKRQRAPWDQPRGLSSVLASWGADTKVAANVVAEKSDPAREGVFVPVPEGVAGPVRRALEARAITQLYAHQAEAFEHAHAGRHVVIATPTASGKSLCYNLPVLTRMAEEPGARALYLFPTKALARDQEASVVEFLSAAGLDQGAITYDGDTPGDARRAARDRAGLIVTNPDMLHSGILPHHASWSRLFANLRYVVIDELHSYRGVFGSHLANVVRRLRRIARFHGSDPVFVFASATIGNPREHAERIVGAKVELVADSGAPTGERRVLVYNPPVVNRELGIRASYVKTTVRLVADLVRAGVSTMVFGQSRNNVEVMLKYLRDRLVEDGISTDAIHAYRGGYLPEQRRAIERGLREGSIRCVVATNALELGIDVGSLDAVVCAGYPGSLASLWQRFGRAGRRGDTSLAVLVASSAPLDQYFALQPGDVFGAPIEHARIDPDNIEILVQHVKCAAFELPFEQGEAFGDVPVEAVGDTLDYLAQNGVVHVATGPEGKQVYHWMADAYPANSVSLRSASWDNFVIIELDRDATLGEMDFRSVHTMLHEQAIYQHAGEQYQVEKLDYENHKAFVRKVAPDYYTDAMSHVRIAVIEEDAHAPMGTASGGGAALRAARGEVSVVERVVGYKKIKFHTHENVGYGEVHLPELQKHTTAFWVTFPDELVDAASAPRPAVIDALRALLNAMHTVACVGLMTDPRDLGRTLGDQSSSDAPAKVGVAPAAMFNPTLFLFDSVAGGIGLAARLFEERDELLRRARRLIEACACDDGCPSCVGPAAGAGGAPPRGENGPPSALADQLAATAPLPGRKRLALELLGLAGVYAAH